MGIACSLLYTGQVFLLKAIAIEIDYVGIKLYFVIVLLE